MKKIGGTFLRIPKPRGHERRRRYEANLEMKNVQRASKALMPERLNEAKERLNEKNSAWLFLSVWFDLRPKEIDNINDQTS